MSSIEKTIDKNFSPAEELVINFLEKE